ncbi:hypothetical protein OCA14_06400 [Bacillus cereus]|nr:hypothetical protein [Bacillus cereus]
MPDGSVVRTGTNYSGKFQEAHDASKASIQNRISNLESGGVKGTGETPKITEIKEKDLGKPPKKVSVKIEPVYLGSSLRPNSFKINTKLKANVR